MARLPIPPTGDAGTRTALEIRTARIPRDPMTLRDSLNLRDPRSLRDPMNLRSVPGATCLRMAARGVVLQPAPARRRRRHLHLHLRLRLVAATSNWPVGSGTSRDRWVRRADDRRPFCFAWGARPAAVQFLASPAVGHVKILALILSLSFPAQRGRRGAAAAAIQLKPRSHGCMVRSCQVCIECVF